MYLSRVAINRQLRKSYAALANPQMMHAAVLNSFPPSCNTGSKHGKQERVLWRVDYIREQTWLYVLSETQPDLRNIVDQFGWPKSGQTGETKDYDPFLERIEIGQQWHFRLHANPVHTIHGKVLAHVTVEQQKQWLRDRVGKNGFHLVHDEVNGEVFDAVDVIYRDVITFKKHPKDTVRVTLSVATFEGLLEVENTEALRQALIFGIGRAKAYGCGLLTLAQL